MYLNRTIEKTILEVASSFPCIVVYGPRQVGKSTTIDYLFGSRYKKITMDDLEDRALAQTNPRLLLETCGYPLIIDEIQKAPQLLDEIKMIIDEKRLEWLKEGRERELLFILTGSNRFELQEGISDSLAGRCGVIEMSSFSSAEKEGRQDPLFSPEIKDLLMKEKSGIHYRTLSEIFDGIFAGGMPDICTGISERNSYFKSYVNTYIEKDVKKLISATNELQFRNFLSIVALRTAQELHYDEIASAVGIDARTCKRWISILQSSGIVYLLQPYMANVSNRIIKAPKLYFMDTGLCSFLCKWQDAVMLEDCAMGGAFFETYIVSEIIKNFNSNNVDPNERLFYYRDIDKKEIDLLYVYSGAVYPIEIKKGASPAKPYKNFDVLEKYKLDIKPGLVIESCDRIRPLNENVYAIPAYLI